MRPRVVPLSSEEEVRAKAYVHYAGWKEAYQGLIDQEYLDARTLELSEGFALRAYREGYKTLLAKVGSHVVGFADYGPCRDGDLSDAGEVYAIYLLGSHHRQGIGTMLMDEALACLDQYPRVVVWVLFMCYGPQYIMSLHKDAFQAFMGGLTTYSVNDINRFDKAKKKKKKKHNNNRNGEGHANGKNQHEG